MKLLTLLTGWRESSFEEYRYAYVCFGGSVLSEPRILQFLHTHFALSERYFIHTNEEEELTGGVCVWNNRYIAGEQQVVHHSGINCYPLNFDELVLPLKPDMHTFLPFRTKFLSDINHTALCNLSHRLNARREVSIVRTVSSKTRSSRERELKRFIASGGSVHSVTDYSVDELVNIYARLFWLRRGKSIQTEASLELLHAIPDLLFGHVLAFNGEPCAMQWVVKSEDHQHIYLDYVNAGTDPLLAHLSVGTLVAWVNIRAAFGLGKLRNKQVRFSFGRPTADYKARWCNREPLYRVIA